MKSARRLLALATVSAFALVALSTAVSAQDGLAPGIYNPNESTPTTMYFHVNGIQDFPVNTQLPSDKYQQSSPLGLVTHSQGCVEVPNLALVSNQHHTYYGYSSPGYVEYDVDEGGKPRYHPERGISFDVKLDGSQDVIVKWFMESQAFGGDGDPVNPNDLAAPPVPEVVVRATIRENDEISVNHEAMNSGAIIAQGQTSPALLAGPLTQAPEDGSLVAHSAGAGKTIYEFTVTAPVEKTDINKDEAYNVRIDVFMEGVPCGGGIDSDQYLMPDFVRVHTSPDFRPQMQWSIMNPLRIEYLHPQFIGDDLVVHTSSNSPWGNYDVRGDQASESQGGLTVDITGPSVPVTFNQVALTARTHEHDHHTEAVDATWVWEYKKDGAKNGLYTITMTAKNDQETAEAVAVAQFEIGSGTVVGCGGQAKGGGQDDCFNDVQPDGGPGTVEESPGVGMVVLMGALAAIGVALRRRN